MPENNSIKLSRECPAMLIPSGTKVLLAAGNEVQITHRLGGNFTVRGVFGMARIEGKDADALGEPTDTPPTHTAEQEQPHAAPDGACASKFWVEKAPAGTISESEIWDAAKTVYDPEIPVNIVDLGLVYRMEIVKNADGKNCVEVDMTLTAPGCAMGPMIANDLKMRLESLPSVFEAFVNIVWDPPWNQDMMSEEARMILGLA